MTVPTFTSSAARVKLRVLTVALIATMWSFAVPRADAAGTHHHRSSMRTRNTTSKKSCTGTNCSALAPIVPALKVVCPFHATDTSCTYVVHLSSQAQVSALDAGFFRFIVDTVPLTGGGADPNGYVTWINNDPDSGTVTWDARSYEVSFTITDTAENASHTIEVDYGCTDTDANGSCSTMSGFTTLVVDVIYDDI